MNLLVCLKNKLKNSSAFTLVEILIVITMSVVLTGILFNLAVSLYNNHQFINLVSARQLDGYLASDFIYQCIKNSREIKQQNDDELDLYCFYDGNWQWLRFSRYEEAGAFELRRSLGGGDPASADFGRSSILINGLDELSLTLDAENNLLKIEIVYQKNNYKTVIRRRINIDGKNYDG